MVVSSSTITRKEGKKVTNVQLISHDVCKAPKFKEIPEIAYKGDLIGVLLSIPLNVSMINDVRNCYM